MMHEAVCSCRVLAVDFSFADGKCNNIIYNQQREAGGERLGSLLNFNHLNPKNTVKESFSVPDIIDKRLTQN